MQIYKYVYLYLNALLYFGGISREIDQIFGIFETATFFCKSMKWSLGEDTQNHSHAFNVNLGLILIRFRLKEQPRVLTRVEARSCLSPLAQSAQICTNMQRCSRTWSEQKVEENL